MATTPTLPPLYSPYSPSIRDLTLYFNRLSHLLSLESSADQARTSLLASNCSWDVLAQRGLALNGLSVAGISLGLGGKSLIALHRPSAFHTDPALPSSTFRPGDPASIVAQEAVRKAAPSGKKKDTAEGEGAGCAVEGVVYKVSERARGKERAGELRRVLITLLLSRQVTETTITLAVSPRDGEDLELPERCRLIKMANSGTFDRMEKAVERVRRLLGVLLENVPAGVEAVKVKGAVEEEEEIKETMAEEVKSVDEETKENAKKLVVATAALSLDSPSSTEPETPLPAPEPTLNLTSNHPSFPLLRTLFGLDPPTSTPLSKDVPLVFFDETLNESQKTAVKFSLESDRERLLSLSRPLRLTAFFFSCASRRLHPWPGSFDASLALQVSLFRPTSKLNPP